MSIRRKERPDADAGPVRVEVVVPPPSDADLRAVARSKFSLEYPIAILPAALPKLQDGTLVSMSAATSSPVYETRGSVAVVSVFGPLLQTAFDCGWFAIDGYDALQARVGAALSDGAVKAVVLAIDSPGGECAGLFDCVRTLRAASKASGKPMVAVANEQMTSAAYALACACAQIVVPDTAMVGSIGVIQARVDFTKANANDGVSVALIASGARKTDSNPNVAMSDDARAALQARVDYLASVFAAEVSGARGVDPAAVLALEAGVFSGPEAVALGLADAVGNVSSAVALASSLASKSKTSGRTAATHSKPTETQTRAKSPQETAGMETVKRALGLKDDATEAEALAAVNDLVAFRTMASNSLGLEGEEVLGAIEGLKATAARVEVLEAEKKELKKGEKDRRRAELVAQGEREGKLTPHQVKEWVPTIGNKELKGFLQTAPRVIPGGKEHREPKDGPGDTADPNAKIAGKTWEQLTNVDKHNLAVSDPASYNALRVAAGLEPVAPLAVRAQAR